MKIMRPFITFSLATFLILVWVPSGGAQTPKRGGTLLIATEKDPQSMDTHKNVSSQGLAILHQIYDSLLNLDDEGNVIPGLAESMPQQLDPVTYLFTLRKGVKFHDGSDFDARDVKFSFDRLMNKDVSLYWKTYQAMIKSVEILDPYKVKITLSAPNVTFLELLAKYHELQIVPRGTGPKITQPVGTGPFKFKDWIKDDRLTVVRNERYWKPGLPYLDQIVYKPFPEPTTRVINLKTGRVDLVHTLPVKNAVELKKDSGIKVLGRSGGEIEQMWFNTTKPPFDNKKVRQAVAYGIDRGAIVDSVFLGFAEAAHNMFPKWHWAYNKNLNGYSYNPEKAKALLREAGYSEKNPLSFTLTATNEPIFVDQAVIIQAQLSKLGVKVNVVPLEKSYWFDSWRGSKGRDFEATIEDFTDYMTDVSWIYRFFSSKSYFNMTAYNSERLGKKGAQNPEVERLLEEVIQVSDRKRAAKMWDEIQKGILDDVPILYLSFYQNIIGLKDYVKNHKILTRNTIPLEKVWVDK